MADQQAPPEDAATAVDTPQGTEQQQTNWQERYENLQPEFTRATQAVSQYEQLIGALQSEDPDTRLQAAQVLGVELARQEQAAANDEFVDPYEQKLSDYERRIAAQEARWEEVTQGAQQQAQEHRDVEHIGVGLAELQKKLGRDLTEREQQTLGDAAWARRDEQGLPDIASVIEDHLDTINTVLSGYRNTKPRKAAVAAGGAAGQQVPDRANETQSDRWERMAQELADRSAET